MPEPLRDVSVHLRLNAREVRDLDRIARRYGLTRPQAARAAIRDMAAREKVAS